MKSRLRDSFGLEMKRDYDVTGEPTTLPDAEKLAEEDKFQFQAWALGLVGARTASSANKGADGGIDGRLYFHEGDNKPRQVILSVKGGNLKADDIRALGQVVTREKADIGVLISLQEPTSGMRGDAASAGFCTHRGASIPGSRCSLSANCSLARRSTCRRPRGAISRSSKRPRPESQRMCQGNCRCWETRYRRRASQMERWEYSYLKMDVVLRETSPGLRCIARWTEAGQNAHGDGYRGQH